MLEAELIITDNVRRAAEEAAAKFEAGGPQHLQLPPPYTLFFLSRTTEGHGDCMYLAEFVTSDGSSVYLYMG